MAPFEIIDLLFSKESNDVRELLKSILMMVIGAAVLIAWCTFLALQSSLTF